MDKTCKFHELWLNTKLIFGNNPKAYGKILLAFCRGTSFITWLNNHLTISKIFIILYLTLTVSFAHNTFCVLVFYFYFLFFWYCCFMSTTYNLFAHSSLVQSCLSLSQNGQALPRVNYHDPPHLNTNHSHLHLITAAITTLIRAPASVHSVVRSCWYYKDRRSTTASSWVYLPEYLTC